MKIFITGATGLTGSEITRSLANSGHRVSALYRHRKFDQPGVEWIKSDLADFNHAITDAVSHADIVIHNAASLNTGNRPPDLNELERINVSATRNLLQLAVKAKIKKFIFTGSLSILKKPLPALITEESEIEPLLPYPRSKYAGERLVTEYAASSGMDFIILRLSSPVGTRLDAMQPTVLTRWIESSLRGEKLQVFGDGGRTQDFVSVKDIARAFVQCVEITGVNGVFNIASGTSVSMLRLASMVTSTFGNSFECSGEDPNGGDRWNISIQKARTVLNYLPAFTSEEAVSELLHSVNQ